MATSSPNRKPLEELGAIFAPYGVGEAQAIDVAQVIEGLEAEYSALRSACVLMDLPHRGTLEISGGERLAFLNNMVTQELKGFSAGEARRSFWLSRKGRVDADLRLVETGERMWVDVDAHRAAFTAESLSGYVFAEDVEIFDRGEVMHRMSLHGPTSLETLSAACGESVELEEGSACEVAVGGAPVVVDRLDSTGEIGLELLAKAADAAIVFGALRDAGEAFGLRCAGWHALNIARIEAGTAVYFLDFGPDSIPQETGCFESRVSLTKGCYLGQEVVARLHSLGKPKQTLVGLDLDGSLQPMTGDLLYAEENEKPVGAVTSATLSPLLGDRAIALAQVRSGSNAPGAKLTLRTGDGEMAATVRATLSSMASV